MATIPIIPSPSNEEQQPQSNWRRTFDPRSRLIINWNRFMFVIWIINYGIDIFSLFIIRVDYNDIGVDFRLAYSILLLRTIGDSFQFLGMIVKFRTAINDPANRIFKRQELIRDPTIIAKKYIKSSFIFEFIATLPLIQVYLWSKLPLLQALSTPYSSSSFLRGLIKIFSIQIWSKFYVVFPFKVKLLETHDIIMRPAWAGALYYLISYIILSQFVGAAYYLSYIYRLFECQAIVYAKQNSKPILGWDALYEECSIDDQIGNGILSDIYKNKIGSRSSLQRFMYCFSWGLKCLSSMGQNFDTSASIVEAVFSFSMTIFGLVLFAGLIAQMQTCIQSLEPGEEQQMIRQREVEEWAKKRQIPSELKKNLQQAVISDMRGLRGQDDDTMLSLLPMDLQCDIRRNLYFGRACNLPFFANMENELVHSFIGHLRIFSCSKETYIVIEGEPVKLILFIFSGKLEMSSVNGGSSDSTFLGAGGLCGSELLTWASLPFASVQNLPSSSQSIKCLTDVEAFSLLAEDLKLLGIHFNYCWKFQQALRRHF